MLPDGHVGRELHAPTLAPLAPFAPEVVAAAGGLASFVALDRDGAVLAGPLEPTLARALEAQSFAVATVWTRGNVAPRAQERAGAKPVCAIGPAPPVRAYALAIEAKTVPHAVIRALLDGELLLALRTYPSELAFALARGVRLHEGADAYEFF